MKSVRAIVSAVAVVAATASASAQEIKLGFMCPLTGGSAPFGVSARDGASLAIKQINAKGGVLGKQLVLVERDTEAKNERGVQLA